MNGGILVSIFLFVGFAFTYADAQSVQINEIMATNTNTIEDEDGDYEDWIELYNPSSNAINLQGYKISDDTNLPDKWVFPNVTIPANGFLLIWASNKNKTLPGQPLHTNFKISASGESIFLRDVNNNLVSSSQAIELINDVSYGIDNGGTQDWVFFYDPTPNAINSSFSFPSLIEEPVFSHNSGLYTNAFQLSIAHSNPDAIIVYTLDGSEPDIANTNGTTYNYKNDYPLEIGEPMGPMLFKSFTSYLYDNPIEIVDRSPLPNVYANMNTRQHNLIVPPQPIRKSTPVRVKVYVNGYESETYSKNYFVWSSGNPFDLPVISLQIQEDYLFDYENGTYTAGIDFDTWRTNNPNNEEWWEPSTSNYWREGIDWEYPMNVEVFEPQDFNSILSIDAGWRIHGNYSRIYAIKNLRWYARAEYDNQTEFNFEVYDEPVYDAVNPFSSSFKTILMRGDGTGGPIAYDVIFNRLIQPFFPEGVSRIKPAVHFINGEYWGLTAFRDRLDQDHFAQYYGLDPDNIAIVDCKADVCTLDEGVLADFHDYIDMRNLIINLDMAIPGNFAQAEELLDMKSFIDHMVLQVYAADNHHERKYWKVKDPENDGFGDGKWRLTTQDFEAAMNSSVNWLEYYANADTWNVQGKIFGNLLDNTGFRNDFINRYADLLNSAFITTRFHEVVNQSFDEIEPYLAEDAIRFPRPNYFTSQEKQELLDWGSNFHDTARSQITNEFGLTGTFNLACNVSDADAGWIKINTIDINTDTPGIPENTYPWTGIYFDQVPLRLVALEKPGYTFSHWSGDFTSTNDSIVITTSENIFLQANYTQDFVPGELIYFWLFDNNLPNDEPMMQINATYEAQGLVGLLNYNSCLTGYPFDNLHPNWRKASMERRNRPTPINYRPEGNNGSSYDESNMRGIQIKQPFTNGANANELILDISTANYKDIVFSFATNSDGAADSLGIFYSDGSNWIPISYFTLNEEYTFQFVDFSAVNSANNNPNFQIAIRFFGDNMTVENGSRVQFNNLAVEGKSVLGIENQSFFLAPKVYPNPSKGSFQISQPENLKQVNLYDALGRIIEMDLKLPFITKELNPGIYLVEMFTTEGQRFVERVIFE